MAEFVTGQRLTAASLNAAIQQASGPTNPTSSWKWMGTTAGKLEASWNNFRNAESQTAHPLDVQVACSELSAPIAVGDHQAYGLRRVFLNLGCNGNGYQSTYTAQYAYHNVPNLGTFNGTPFIGVLGIQETWDDAPYQQPGPNEPTFSLWFNYGDNHPATDTPQEWTAVQKLYEENACRNCSKDNWWWTGITLERSKADALAYGDDLQKKSGEWMLDIVAYPLLIDVTFTSLEYSQKRMTMPLLCVSTKLDFLLRSRFIILRKQQLLNMVNYYYGNPNMWNFVAHDAYFVNDEDLVQTAATYNSSSQTLDATYKQVTNNISFTTDNSAWKFRGWYSNTTATGIVLGDMQYISQKGDHCKLGSSTLQMTQPGTGTPVQEEPPTFSVTGIGAGYNLSTDVFYSRYQVIDPDLLSAENGISAVLSGMFADKMTDPAVSANFDMRLVAVNYPNDNEWRYYDTCPNFMQGGSVTLSGNVNSNESHTGNEFFIESYPDSRVSAHVEHGTGRIRLGVYYV